MMSNHTTDRDVGGNGSAALVAGTYILIGLVISIGGIGLFLCARKLNIGMNRRMTKGYRQQQKRRPAKTALSDSETPETDAYEAGVEDAPDTAVASVILSEQSEGGGGGKGDSTAMDITQTATATTKKGAPSQKFLALTSAPPPPTAIDIADDPTKQLQSESTAASDDADDIEPLEDQEL